MAKLLYFWQPNCPACDVAKTVLDQVKQTLPEAEIIPVNARTHEGRILAMDLQVRVTPTIIAVSAEGKRLAGSAGGMINPVVLERFVRM